MRTARGVNWHLETQPVWPSVTSATPVMKILSARSLCLIARAVRLGQLAAVSAALAAVVLAAEPPVAPSAPSVDTGGTNRVPFSRRADGTVQIGKVRLDPRQRTVSFPAQLNMAEGIVEYLLVSTAGKTHESLLKTEAEPFHIQTAMILLGASGSTKAPRTNAPAGGQLSAEQIRLASKLPLVGESVSIEVEWTTKGMTNRCALEDLVWDAKAGAAMKRGPFVFTGSVMFQGAFLAQQEGSIIAVITDLSAIFNNPRPRRDDEDNWKVAGDRVPPLDTGMNVIISVPPVQRAPVTP